MSGPSEVGGRQLRVLVTGAGSGASGNLFRALRSLAPAPYLVGVNHDRFSLKQAVGDKHYLVRPASDPGFAAEIAGIMAQERINAVLPTDDETVKALSEGRDALPIDLKLPSRETIDLCQDKYRLNLHLRACGVAVPAVAEVVDLGDLEAIFGRFAGERILWCRVRHGSRALAATPVMTLEQARSWITLWRDLRGIRVADFTIGEHLPGRHFLVPTIWSDGVLLRAQTTEILSYFAAGNNPSGTFSLSSLAKTVAAPDALATALAAVRAVSPRPTGAFSIELKESEAGVASVTEINIGRFPAGISALIARKGDNMIGAFASFAAGDRLEARDPAASPLEFYLVRDIDAVPGVFTAEALMDDV